MLYSLSHLPHVKLRPASDGWCSDCTQYAIPFMRKLTPNPPVKNAISQLVTSVLVGTKHLALNGGNCQDSSKSTLTAIASSVANITSTDHEDLMFDGLSARKQRDPWALALCVLFSFLCPVKIDCWETFWIWSISFQWDVMLQSFNFSWTLLHRSCAWCGSLAWDRGRHAH